jgi:hypothetical protein
LLSIHLIWWFHQLGFSQSEGHAILDSSPLSKIPCQLCKKAILSLSCLLFLHLEW